MCKYPACTSDQAFFYLAEWQVVVCKECHYAVWPDEIQGHLHGKKHRILKKEAGAIAKEVEEWPGIARYSGEVEFAIQSSVRLRACSVAATSQSEGRYTDPSR